MKGKQIVVVSAAVNGRGRALWFLPLHGFGYGYGAVPLKINSPEHCTPPKKRFRRRASSSAPATTTASSAQPAALAGREAAPALKQGAAGREANPEAVWMIIVGSLPDPPAPK